MQGNLESSYFDLLLERARPIKVGGEILYLYPKTLAKMLIQQRLISNLGIEAKHLLLNESLEILRVVCEHKEICCELLAWQTSKNDSTSLNDYEAFEHRKQIFMKESEEDIASLVSDSLSDDVSLETITKHFGIDKEQGRFRKVFKVKKKQSITFGGKTLVGSFILPLMEMGFTKQEVVYERSYTFLRLALEDKMKDVYLSDEERKKLSPSLLNDDNDSIKATKENIQKIMSMNWK